MTFLCLGRSHVVKAGGTGSVSTLVAVMDSTKICVVDDDLSPSKAENAGARRLRLPYQQPQDIRASSAGIGVLFRWACQCRQ